MQRLVIKGCDAARYLGGALLGEALDLSLYVIVRHTVPYYAAPGDKPIPIGQFPAILAALTEGGQGEPVALLRTWLTHGHDGMPTKIDETTLRSAATQAGLLVDHKDEFPARKLTSGGCGTAAIWMGRSTDSVVIAEGLETALYAMYAGFYAAASCGVSRLHVLAMAPGIKTVILAPDRQDVAEAAALLAAEVYTVQGFAVRIAHLPRSKQEGYDLNDLLRDEGPDAVQAILDAAEPFVPPRLENEPKCDEEAARKVPEDLLDVPGVYGDLAGYLCGSDEYNDRVKALVFATAAMLSVSAGFQVHALANWTHPDINMILTASSGRGKTRTARCTDRLVRSAVGDRTLLRIGGIGTAEGHWDALEATQLQNGLPAQVLVADEFGDELRRMGDGRSYKSSYTAFLRKMTNGATGVHYPETLSLRTKANPRGPLRYPVFSMIGISTPTQFAVALNGRLLEDGTEARLMVFASPRDLERDPTEVPMPPRMEAKLAAIFERTRIAMEAARNGGNPNWAMIKVPDEVAKLLEILRQRQEVDARPFVMRDDPWSSVIQRRMERVIKFALLYAISEAFDKTPLADPVLSMEGVKWACKVVAFAEDSHRTIRGHVVSLGQRAQDERELSERVLSWLSEKCKGGKAVRLRKLLRALNLPKDAALTAVNTLIAQGRVLASGTVDGEHVPDLTEVPMRGAREVDLRLRSE